MGNLTVKNDGYTLLAASTITVLTVFAWLTTFWNHGNHNKMILSQHQASTPTSIMRDQGLIYHPESSTTIKTSYFIIYPAYWTRSLSIPRQLENWQNWLPSADICGAIRRYDAATLIQLALGHSVGDCDSLGARCDVDGPPGLLCSKEVEQENPKIDDSNCMHSRSVHRGARNPSRLKIDGEFLLALSFAVALCGPLLAND